MTVVYIVNYDSGVLLNNQKHVLIIFGRKLSKEALDYLLIFVLTRPFYSEWEVINLEYGVPFLHICVRRKNQAIDFELTLIIKCQVHAYLMSVVFLLIHYNVSLRKLYELKKLFLNLEEVVLIWLKH